MYLIIAIVGTILFFGLMSAYSKFSVNRSLEKQKNVAITESKKLLDKIGELEGKPIDEIKAVIGEPKNVEIVDGSRILTWPGLQLLCTNDKEMIVKEVLKNVYK